MTLLHGIQHFIERQQHKFLRLAAYHNNEPRYSHNYECSNQIKFDHTWQSQENRWLDFYQDDIQWSDLVPEYHWKV